jgi:hypothetical protein
MVGRASGMPRFHLWQAAVSGGPSDLGMQGFSICIIAGTYQAKAWGSGSSTLVWMHSTCLTLMAHHVGTLAECMSTRCLSVGALSTC